MHTSLLYIYIYIYYTYVHAFTCDIRLHLHNYTTTQLHNYTTTQLHNYTTTQLHNYTYPWAVLAPAVRAAGPGQRGLHLAVYVCIVVFYVCVVLCGFVFFCMFLSFRRKRLAYNLVRVWGHSSQWAFYVCIVLCVCVLHCCLF